MTAVDSQGFGRNHRQINFVTYLEYRHMQGAWKSPESYFGLEKTTTQCKENQKSGI